MAFGIGFVLSSGVLLVMSMLSVSFGLCMMVDVRFFRLLLGFYC